MNNLLLHFCRVTVLCLSVAITVPALAAKAESYDAPPSSEGEGGAARFFRGAHYERTYDTLTAEENQELQRLSDLYMEQIKNESLPLIQVHFDTHTILRSFPEQIRIIRQRQRPLLLQVERYLYSLRLNPEFITSYVDRLEKDSVNYALDLLIKKANAIGSRRR